MIEVDLSKHFVDSPRRIADVRRAAESQLKAAIAAIPESRDIETYLPPFCFFASALFDAGAEEALAAIAEAEEALAVIAEAEEALAAINNKDVYKRFLQDLAIRTIEGILPDADLESGKANSSLDVGKPSIEQEIGSERLSERQLDSTIASSRPAIQAVYSQHGDWENFAPHTVRFRLRLEKNDLVRENLRQVLEQRSFYWLERFSLRPEVLWDRNAATKREP